MGGLCADSYVPNVLTQINRRFMGDALTEMIALQKEFKVFSPQHTLRSAFALLGIAPVEERDRNGFMIYFDRLKKTAAELDGTPTATSGHDQIMLSIQQNLESNNPKPVFFTNHASGRTKGTVRISYEQVLSFSSESFLTISFPMISAEAYKMKAGSRGVVDALIGDQGKELLVENA
ncbi:hypothetical protein UP09_00860 [Bradyrhizobium sp. LTSP885]|uniref:hypothetical protein n=1 Tax=Bradyrhizobium sp. LTSP885 TaxID=1619232 RepID=UPI0005C862AD|nr:hypothetical protein [Bradyrhizobium sp. LTSP885]KJC52924.1 hypothetical protein UP09_00860 [Bradyrhizobium sp. LTSP885]